MVKCVVADGGVAMITIDRPEAANAISTLVIDELDATLTELDGSHAKALFLRGEGDRTFISGGDLKEFRAIRDRREARAMAVQMRRVLDRIATMSIPVVALLNGDAYGGGAEVATACDFRVAASHARVGFVQIRHGITPAWGGVERLCGLVGRARAMYLLMMGRVLAAQEAAAWGLVEEVVPSDGFESRCDEIAESLASVPAAALGAIKTIGLICARSVYPESAEVATTGFVDTWVSDEHWEAVARMGWSPRPTPPSTPATDGS